MASISNLGGTLESVHSEGGPSKKRARAGTVDEPQESSKEKVPEYDIGVACAALSEADVRNLLLEEAVESPELAARVRRIYHAIILRESAKVVDFDHHSKSVWREINIDHKYKSGSWQYEAAFDVFRSVCDTITHISEQVHPHSPYATKRSALETLRKIGKTICLSNDTIGAEVKKDFQSNTTMEEGMQNVVRSMTEQERSEMCEHADGEFLEKLRELIRLAEGQCVMKNLRKVLTKLEHRRERGPGGDGDSYLGEEETESEDELEDPGDYD